MKSKFQMNFLICLNRFSVWVSTVVINLLWNNCTSNFQQIEKIKFKWWKWIMIWMIKILDDVLHMYVHVGIAVNRGHKFHWKNEWWFLFRFFVIELCHRCAFSFLSIVLPLMRELCVFYHHKMCVLISWCDCKMFANWWCYANKHALRDTWLNQIHRIDYNSFFVVISFFLLLLNPFKAKYIILFLMLLLKQSNEYFRCDEKYLIILKQTFHIESEWIV